jgi:pSer/pThr/pTyr-binding forkhead associated (FHA) protein
MIGTQGQPATLSLCLGATEGLSRAEFLRDYPDPVFLIEPFVAPDDTGFATLTGVKTSGNEDLVVVLKKRAGANAFTHMVTIGRAGNNDVVIRYRGVSKFHAYLQVDEAGGSPTRLVDAGSTNGTFVRDQELVGHGEAVPLEAGSEVKFSDLTLVYYGAESFYDFLRSRR